MYPVGPSGPGPTPTVRPSDGRADGRTVGWSDRWMDGQTDGRSVGRSVGHADGRMVGRTDGRTDGTFFPHCHQLLVHTYIYVHVHIYIYKPPTIDGYAAPPSYWVGVGGWLSGRELLVSGWPPKLLQRKMILGVGAGYLNIPGTARNNSPNGLLLMGHWDSWLPVHLS
jgi:hypothetical protein